MIDMEPSWLTICSQIAAIGAFAISIIYLFINLFRQKNRIKNNEIKINGIIVNRISQPSQYKSEGNQIIIINPQIFHFAIPSEQINNAFKD